MQVVLDLETIPTESPDVIADIAATIKPPGNMKKADTIAAWEASEKQAVVDEAVLKTAFDGTYGRIIVIGYAVDDAEPVALTGLESVILSQFADNLSKAIKLNYDSQGNRPTGESSVVFIGHNLVGFDLRFLWQRAVINQVQMPYSLLKACRAKPWDGMVADTMTMWHPDRDKRISLDRLCKALGVPTSKGDMDGSKVYEAFKAGEIERIAEYCRGDIQATRECYKRLTFA